LPQEPIFKITNYKHQITNKSQIPIYNDQNHKFDGLVKSPKLRHASEGRHPELFKNTGSRLRVNDAQDALRPSKKASSLGFRISVIGYYL
jgi:hypothetical protein